MEKQLSDFTAAGVRPVAISVDPPQVSSNLSKKAGYTFTILSDPDTAATRQYRLLHIKGGPNGSDIARPAEFLIDPSGTVRWRMVSKNFFVLARPDQVLEAAQSLQ